MHSTELVDFRARRALPRAPLLYRYKKRGPERYPGLAARTELEPKLFLPRHAAACLLLKKSHPNFWT